MNTGYADSSFIVRLLLAETRSESAVRLHERLHHPRLFFNFLHHLEVSNALSCRTFMAKAGSSSARQSATRHEQSARRRLALNSRMERFVDQQVDWETTFREAEQLSAVYSARLGVRALDLLHVQLALLSPTRDFLTCDIRQASLAKAAGLKVFLVEP